MLNNNFAARFTVSSVPGTIVKSHPKSKFKTAHINSQYMDGLENKTGIVVLQIMQSHESRVIVEYVNVEDYTLEP